MAGAQQENRRDRSRNRSRSQKRQSSSFPPDSRPHYVQQSSNFADVTGHRSANPNGRDDSSGIKCPGNAKKRVGRQTCAMSGSRVDSRKQQEPVLLHWLHSSLAGAASLHVCSQVGPPTIGELVSCPVTCRIAPSASCSPQTPLPPTDLINKPCWNKLSNRRPYLAIRGKESDSPRAKFPVPHRIRLSSAFPGAVSLVQHPFPLGCITMVIDSA